MIQSGGPYPNEPSGSTLDVEMNLSAGTYELNVNDSWGDGMCCNYGEGGVDLSWPGGSWSSGKNFTGDHFSTTFTVSAGGSNNSGSDVTLTLNFDSFPQDISWEIISGGAVIQSGGPYPNEPSGSTLDIETNLSAGTYELNVNDSWGDGMCCNYGEGGVDLSWPGGSWSSGEDFTGDEISTTFTVSASGSTNGASNVTLTLNFDSFPQDISWEIISGGAVIQSGGPYPNEPGGSTLEIEMNLSAGSYELNVNDSWGDGMCCNYGEGGVDLSWPGGSWYSGEDFTGDHFSTTFIVSAGGVEYEDTLHSNDARWAAIDYAGDEDVFRITVPSSGTLTVYTTGITDTYGYLLDSSGNQLASNDDGGQSTNFSFSYSVSAGTFYVRVRHYSPTGTGSYTINTKLGPPGDRDGDGIGDKHDPDIDGDGIPNERDQDVDNDGQTNAQDDDDDGDGTPDATDEDPNGPIPETHHLVTLHYNLSGNEVYVSFTGENLDNPEVWYRDDPGTGSVDLSIRREYTYRILLYADEGTGSVGPSSGWVRIDLKEGPWVPVTGEGNFFGQQIEVDTEGNGQSDSEEIQLLPVAILVPKVDSEGNEIPGALKNTDKLKVAKWEKAFAGTPGKPVIDPHFNDNDIDRFYFRASLPGKKGDGTAQIKIKTASDPENLIELTETPENSGTFQSKALILVSNDDDDQYPPNTDEKLNDITHKVKLGDVVTFTIPLDGEDASFTATVHIRGTLKLDVWRIDAIDNHFDPPKKISSLDEINDDVERLKETYAQVGLKIESKVDEVEWPATVAAAQVGTKREGLPGYLKIFEGGGPPGRMGPYTQEYKAFVDAISNCTIRTVDLYYLYSTHGTAGIAVTISAIKFQPGITNYKYVDHAFINDFWTPIGWLTPCHELLHILAPEENHAQHYFNLLTIRTATVPEPIFDRKRINAKQEALIYGHPAVVDSND